MNAHRDKIVRAAAKYGADPQDIADALATVHVGLCNDADCPLTPWGRTRGEALFLRIVDTLGQPALDFLSVLDDIESGKLTSLGGELKAREITGRMNTILGTGPLARPFQIVASGIGPVPLLYLIQTAARQAVQEAGALRSAEKSDAGVS